MAYRITFHGELGYFFNLRNDRDKSFVTERFAPLKDIIEGLGVPHTEVGRIKSEGIERDFRYIPKRWETIHVYPVEQPCDVTTPTLLRPVPLKHVLFVADVNVGKLARLLRLLGFDTEYGNDWEDAYIADRSQKERRIVLTKDRNLLKRKTIEAGRLVRAVKPWDQLAEMILLYGLQDAIRPFGICPVCNGKLEEVEKERILDRIEPLTRLFVDEFRQCPKCGRIYWSGTHSEDIMKRIEVLKRIGK